MRALPELEAAAAVGQARLDVFAFLRSTDHVERQAVVLVANRINQVALSNEDQRDANLSARIGNIVSRHVSKALSEALQAISRAMRG